jgi:hypothetical protein
MNEQEIEFSMRLREVTLDFDNSKPLTGGRVSVMLKILLCFHDYYDVWTQGRFAERRFPEVAFNKIRDMREYDYKLVPEVSEETVRTIHELCDLLLDDMIIMEDEIIG